MFLSFCSTNNAFAQLMKQKNVVIIDTVIFGKPFKVDYVIDEEYKDYLLYTSKYPLYIHFGKQIDSVYIWNFDTSMLSERHSEYVKEYHDTSKTVPFFNIIKKNRLSKNRIAVIDSSVFIQVLTDFDCFGLILIDIQNSRMRIDSRLLISINEFVFIPDKKLIGISFNRGDHSDEILFIKYINKEFYNTKYYLKYSPYKNIPLKISNQQYNSILKRKGIRIKKSSGYKHERFIRFPFNH